MARMLWLLAVMLWVAGCDQQNFNNPYPKSQREKNIIYSSFSDRPKTLDSARSYEATEQALLAQIVEPPLQYHYLLRPYTLVTLAAAKMPSVEYFNAQHQRLIDASDTKQVAYSVYTIHLKPHRFYQPHPAFVKTPDGQLFYHDLDDAYLSMHDIATLSDFKKQATREVTADDYVYQIKRLASPKTNSPISGVMKEHIEGFAQYTQQLQKIYKEDPALEQSYFDLRKYPMSGLKVVDRYTYQITLKGMYPQFIYWLAMSFFSPTPWEADYFYSQEPMDDHNITFDWFPVGSGPYFLEKNNPNNEMVMQRNPNFSGERYPMTGMPGDKEKGLLDRAGKQLPFVDTVIYKLEKEAIPRWNKFLQGYYDNSGINSDSFDEAITIDTKGVPHLTPLLAQHNIKFYRSVSPTIFYYGFNMLDPVVGGTSERARLLRQAISIAVDTEEFINIFLNGRGTAAQGALPPGIFGFRDGQQGIDPNTYEWKNNHAQRRSIDDAKKLLEQAGYPEGRDPATGNALVLNYDVPASSGPDDSARLDWMRKQFAKLGIELHIRPTQYNRFQDIIRTGNAQIFSWGWHADYPDPENFFFLYYSKNSRVKFEGENATNYENAKFDALFEKMKDLPNGPARLAVIDEMQNILRHDAPVVWGFFPQSYLLSQSWVSPMKSNEIANNVLKYYAIDPVMREKLRTQWNKPKFFPVVVLLLLCAIVILPVYLRLKRREYTPRKGKK